MSKEKMPYHIRVMYWLTAVHVIVSAIVVAVELYATFG